MLLHILIIILWMCSHAATGSLHRCGSCCCLIPIQIFSVVVRYVTLCAHLSLGSHGGAIFSRINIGIVLHVDKMDRTDRTQVVVVVFFFVFFLFPGIFRYCDSRRVTNDVVYTPDSTSDYWKRLDILVEQKMGHEEFDSIQGELFLSWYYYSIVDRG